jgi:hypothetical protein
MFPSPIDGGFQVVGQDDELGQPVIVMGAERHDAEFLC